MRKTRRKNGKKRWWKYKEASQGGPGCKERHNTHNIHYHVLENAKLEQQEIRVIQIVEHVG